MHLHITLGSYHRLGENARIISHFSCFSHLSLRHKNIGILITDHNVYETLSICDRAYLLFEGKVLFQGTAEQLAENEIVREKYLGKDFVLRKKDL